jgi:GTP-binding protein Era
MSHDVSGDNINIEIKTRCGAIALIGSPNAGKSTLLNQLVGGKVSIVSPKVQTTRTIINGICTEGDAQLIFVDTPGIFKPERPLERSIVRAAWRGFDEADYIAVLVDVSRKNVNHQVDHILEALEKQQRKASLILNKIDLVKPTQLLAVAQYFQQRYAFDHILMVSALTGDGVGDIKAHLAHKIPAGPWLFDPEDMTDIPMRFLACEITREKIFLQLEQELPYSMAVDLEQWQEDEKGHITIHQVIYVQRDNHKAMVLGKAGQRIKQIGQAARIELEEILATRIHLYLHVKVKENWLESPSLMEAMRLVPNQ